MEVLSLSFFAFLAGFVDAVVGGGGLIQLPAMFLFLPAGLSQSVPAVFGTNKMSSFCGTSMAVFQYSRRVRFNWKFLLPSACMALLFSFLGARTVSGLNTKALKPVILLLLVAVAIYTFKRKDFGEKHRPRLGGRKEIWAGMLVGTVIGFYDGFFGPGTGSFLIFIFISFFGFDFLTASANAKAINFATNLSAVAYFAWTGNILFHYALPMAACNVAGSFAGSRLAVLKGNAFVRVFFLVVVSIMILRFGYDLWKN